MSKHYMRYLKLLSQQFPTTQAVYTEIINLEAILNLPKATEHFLSDVHGEYEAFDHILDTCSGVIRERIASIFKDDLSPADQADLCTLIYFPTEKLRRVRTAGEDTPVWYAAQLMHLIRLARHLSYNYTRSKVRKAMPVEYAYIIDELLHASNDEAERRQLYHARIIETIIETGSADDFIHSLSDLIKRLAVDRLHVVGDLFDRGPHADRIIERLMGYHAVDFQWGNHDIVWMGAAAGSPVCVAAVVRTQVHYGTLQILESGYGVSLRELYGFAEATYRSDDVISPAEKAIDMILFKLEGQAIMRHPAWDMSSRLLLGHIDREAGTVTIDGSPFPLITNDLPTLDANNPYKLTSEEEAVVAGLVEAFLSSGRLQVHVDFLYEHGSVYAIRNGNLLFHGCVPLNEDGTLREVWHHGVAYKGRAYLDLTERIARNAWLTHDERSLDWMWYLWCGRTSPLSGRITKTFEHALVADESTWHEPRDPYFSLTQNPEECERILAEFGLTGPRSHIINGHTPVLAARGQSPLKAGGRVIVIDGGFAEAYHARTGIAGYTLISDAQGLRIKAHRPFASIKDALDLNADIVFDTDRFELEETPLLVDSTDDGAHIRSKLKDLRNLLGAYRSGEIREQTGRL